MKKAHYILTILSLLILISCAEKESGDYKSIDYYEVPILSTNKKIYKINGINLKPLKMDSTLNSSFVGNLWANNNELYFSDTYFNYIYNLDLDGNVLNTYLGRGGGPKEINDLDDIVPNKDGSYTVLGSSTSSIYNYGKSWSIINKSIIDFGMKRGYNEVLENPEPSLPESYELETGYDNSRNLSSSS